MLTMIGPTRRGQGLHLHCKRKTLNVSM